MCKTKKLFFILIVLAFIFVLFSFPVSAAGTTYYFNCNRPMLTGADCYVEGVSSNGTPFIVYCKTWVNNSVDSTTLNVRFEADVRDDILYITPIPTSYSTGNGTFAISCKGIYYDANGYIGTCGNSGSSVTVTLKNIGSISQFIGYNCDTTSITTNGNFIFAYGNDYNINSKLDSIISAIRAGQQEQTNQIIANQDKNTEEIKNGWDQEENIDTSTTDDYAAKDKELQAATNQGRSEAVSVFNSFGSLFQGDGHLYKGLLSVSAIFTQFMQLDWLSSLLNFSLAIGIFAFVIGTGSEIFKSSHERYKDDKISKIDSYDERWLM